MLSLSNKRKGIFLSLSICILFSCVWHLVPHPAIILVLCALPLACIFTLHYSFLIVLLFLIFSFFRIHEVFPQLYSLKIPLLLSLGAIFSLGWHITITENAKPFWCKELRYVCYFFGAVFVGLFIASNRPIAIAYFNNIYWKIIVMLFAIAWMTKQSKDFELASKLIVIFGSLVGLVAISNKLSGIGLVEETRVTIGRDLGSVLGDPNDLALVLMFPSAFAVSFLATNGLNRSTKLLGYISVPVLFFAIMATQSRGGLLGMLTVFSFFAYRKIKNKILFFSLGGVFACILFIFAGISDRKSGGASEAGIDASAQGRLYAWEAAYGMALDNPLSGVGIDNFYSNYYFYSKHWDGLNHAVHSTWFGVLAETGFLGFILFVNFIVVLAKSAKYSQQYIEQNIHHIPSPQAPPMLACSQALLAGLYGTIISGTFLTHGFTWPIYILAGLIIALSQWRREFEKALDYDKNTYLQ